MASTKNPILICFRCFESFVLIICAWSLGFIFVSKVEATIPTFDMQWPKTVNFRVGKEFYGQGANYFVENATIENCTTIANLLPVEYQTFKYIEVLPGSCLYMYPTHDCTEPIESSFISWRKIRITDVKQHWNILPSQTPVRTLRYCFNECKYEINEESLKQERKGTVPAIFYEYRDFEGFALSLKLSGCTIVPTSLKKRIASIRLHDDCVVVYTSKDCNQDEDHRVIRSPPIGLRFLNTWNLVIEDRIIALSSCFYFCLNSTYRFMFPIGSNTISDLGQEDVVLYDETDFYGNYIQQQVSSCFTLPRDFSGKTLSINASKCIMLYSDADCLGEAETYRLNPTTDPQILRNLKSIKFHKNLRSIEPCSKEDLTQPMTRGNFKKSRTNLATSRSVLGTQFIWPATVVIALIVSIGAAIFVLVISRRRQKLKKEYMSVLDFSALKEEADKFLHGYDSKIENVTIEEYIESSIALCSPYDTRFEIVKCRIEIDQQSILGSGQFGVVYKGSFCSSLGSSMAVAVKTVKPYAHIEYFKALLKEIKVMIYVGKHPNIAELMGCCTKNIEKGKLLVVLKLYELGSLEKYLRMNKAFFKSDYQVLDVVPETSYMQLEAFETNLNPALKKSQLRQWCIEISDGMEYLAYKKVIHGDLATRNILLDEHLTAKISDFGLSVQLHQYYEYIKNKNTPLPWRWLAIESLINLKFSTKSDVWSYAVTVWEIFNFGDLPFKDFVHGPEFLKNLQEGMRLKKPKLASDSCFNMMIKCWDVDPEKRPTFTEIKNGMKQNVMDRSYKTNINMDLQKFCLED